ncbi:MAG: glutaredoxin family protein [Cocleimonas sp.]
MPVFSKQLIVYYRESCHLCEHVVASLFQLQTELEFEIKQLDIDDQSQVSVEIRARYNSDVPVVIYGEEVVFYHFFDEIAVREALADSLNPSS